MSFAADTKNELCNDAKMRECCRFAELVGIVLFGSSFADDTIKIQTENALLAVYVLSLLEEVVLAKAELSGSKNALRVSIEQGFSVMEKLKLTKDKRLIYRIPENTFHKSCCKKAFIKGAFLGAGFVSDPEKNYHLELVCSHYGLASDVLELLSEFGIYAKISRRKSSDIVYIKEGDAIADFLSLIGATNSMLEFTNTKILKDMRNNVNRVVNCETANVSKTVNASVDQIKWIEKIDRHIGIKSLPPQLYELCRLRLENRNSPLKDLGQMLSPPVSKSGINHRFNKIKEIAENIEGE